jgi:hypothetical protein
MRSNFGICLLLIWISASCKDASLPEPVASISRGPATDLTPDPPQEWPVSINSAFASVAMPPSSAAFPAVATVNATMHYDAYHSSMGALVNVTGPSSGSRLFPAVERHTATFRGNSWSTSFPVVLNNSCGHTVVGSVEYAAWFLGLVPNSNVIGIWDKDTVSRAAAGSQLGCPEAEETQAAAPAGEGDCPTCIQEPAEGPKWCRVWYQYDLKTGEILTYRILYCW